MPQPAGPGPSSRPGISSTTGPYDPTQGCSAMKDASRQPLTPATEAESHTDMLHVADSLMQADFTSPIAISSSAELNLIAQDRLFAALQLFGAEGISELLGPDHIDIHVGKQLKRRRCDYGLEQQDLARSLDVPLALLQRFETGNARIGTSRMYALAKILEVPISYFFETLPATSPRIEITRRAMETAIKLDALPNQTRNCLMSVIDAAQTPPPAPKIAESE